MSSDLNGMTEAVGESHQVMIPLGPRRARLAAGIALVRDGATISAAAKQLDVPVTTLWRHVRGISEVESEKGVQVNERALVAASFDMAQIAAEKITDRLLDKEHPWKDGDLVKVYGVATDKIAMRRGWARGLSAADEKTQDALAGALQDMRNGASIKMVPADPADQATTIEVEATTEEGER